MKIGIISDKFKDPGFHIARSVSEILNGYGVETVFPDTRTEHQVEQSSGDELWEGVDLAISIGGDGTFLYTSKEVYLHEIPLIGINRGSLGFMTEIHMSDLQESLKKLANGEYFITDRMMLDVAIYDENDALLHRGFGLNDAVLYRGDISKIIPCRLYINDTYIQTILSDGIIIAAPSGSTGYAMSAGGPIIDPELELMLVTPLSPHSLMNRSYAVNHNDHIELKINREYPYSPTLSVDGREGIKITNKQRISIKKAEKDLHIAAINKREFFAGLPDKLNARGMGRNEN